MSHWDDRKESLQSSSHTFFVFGCLVTISLMVFSDCFSRVRSKFLRQSSISLDDSIRLTSYSIGGGEDIMLPFPQWLQSLRFFMLEEFWIARSNFFRACRILLSHSRSEWVSISGINKVSTSLLRMRLSTAGLLRRLLRSPPRVSCDSCICCRRKWRMRTGRTLSPRRLLLSGVYLTRFRQRSTSKR